jgi:hypothetical protein
MAVSNAEPDAPSQWACGCVTGRRLCADAVCLWRQTSTALQQSASLGDFASYREACRAFDAHYARQEQAAAGRG